MPSLSIFCSVLTLSTVALAGVTYRDTTTLDTTSTSDALSGTHDGQITWYATGNSYGACGTELSDTQAICALGTALFDQCKRVKWSQPPTKGATGFSLAGLTRNELDTPDGNPNKNTLCGKAIQVTMSDGSTAKVAVADRCMSCQEYDLDLTPTVFEDIVAGGLGVGRTVAAWQFL